MKAKENEAIRRAIRTFLQCACGSLLSAGAGGISGILPAMPPWKTALSAALSALAAGILAALMNRGGKEDDSQKGD